MTTVSLEFAAQVVLDFYYQDYAPEGAFIELTHVKSLMYSEYQSILEAEYRAAKILNRTLEGFGYVLLDGDVLVAERVEIKKEGCDYVGILSTPAFTFNSFDTIGTSIQRVRNMDEQCRVSELIRINSSENWMYDIAPPTGKGYFYSQNIANAAGCPTQSKIFIKGQCIPKEVEVLYPPSLTEGGDIQINQRLQKRISDSVLQSLLIAKQQVIVDKSNDGNPNAALTTEANPDNVQPNP